MTNLRQEALDALVDKALGTTSPAEGFLQGYAAGRAAVETKQEIEDAASTVYRYMRTTGNALPGDPKSLVEVIFAARRKAVQRQVEETTLMDWLGRRVSDE